MVKQFQSHIERRRVALLLAALFMATAGTQANANECTEADLKFSKEYDSCMDKSGGVTVDMRACIHNELERQDVRLNRVYQKYSASLVPNVLKSLREAQRAWIQYRNKDCAWAGAPDENATLGPLIIDGCHLDMTVRRANEFESLLSPR
ncbi:lysozyme inhibitor LprI family protein [Noviherbaspirillum sp. Root189]|uniref:lysozyme inhibitor LprI family protein n=1 Tax=Noviherbaspirillum sp. Root189 TaxID=1736487 RepID=UPI001F2789ED|nr:lysozyme inhibitor LprI family protein [Noviherbaspirillum sp. Root189]